LAGSAANNVVVGGGSNQFTGGLGRDLLIAGPGASKLIAGSGGDLLIGGWTTYTDLTGNLIGTGTNNDLELFALKAIMAEWGSTDRCATRVNLLTNGGGQNGSYRLNASTVHDNGQAHTLFGTASLVPLDWFFAGGSDQVKKSSEMQFSRKLLKKPSIPDRKNAGPRLIGANPFGTRAFRIWV
jgi:hypothetical protein